MKKKQEKRLFEIRSMEQEDGTRTLTGYAAKFNALSDDLGGFREQIMPGAFSEAIGVSDVRALYNHNSNLLPLGRTPDTLRLLEDDQGLKIEIDLPDTQFAKDLAVSIDRGDITQMSFAFSVLPDGQEWEEQANGSVIRSLNKISRLFDVSPVVYPAYPDTEIAVRSLEEHRKAGEQPTVDVGKQRSRALDIREKIYNRTAK